MEPIIIGGHEFVEGVNPLPELLDLVGELSARVDALSTQREVLLSRLDAVEKRAHTTERRLSAAMTAPVVRRATRKDS